MQTFDRNPYFWEGTPQLYLEPILGACHNIFVQRRKGSQIGRYYYDMMGEVTRLYTYIHIYINTYIHTYIYIYTYIHIYIHTYLHPYIYVESRYTQATLTLYKHTYIQKYWYLLICVYWFNEFDDDGKTKTFSIHTHTHTYTITVLRVYTSIMPLHSNSNLSIH